jgi:hypothetical protein
LKLLGTENNVQVCNMLAACLFCGSEMQICSDNSEREREREREIEIERESFEVSSG